MTRCVVDTNIVVYYLNQVGGDDFRRRFSEIVEKGAVISVITRIEVLSERRARVRANSFAEVSTVE